MSNMTPFEIRLELLKMAKDMLSDDYYGKRESISNQYASQCEYAKLNGQPVPSRFSIIPLRDRNHCKGSDLKWFCFKHPTRNKDYT